MGGLLFGAGDAGPQLLGLGTGSARLWSAAAMTPLWISSKASKAAAGRRTPKQRHRALAPKDSYRPAQKSPGVSLPARVARACHVARLTPLAMKRTLPS